MKRNTATVLMIFGILLTLIALNLAFLVDKDEDETEEKSKRSTYRSTPYGIKALYSLLEESRYPVQRLEHPFTDLPGLHNVGTLVMIDAEEEFNPAPAEFESLSKWIASGKLCVLVGRKISVPFDEHTYVATQLAGYGKEARVLQPTDLTRGVTKISLSDFASSVRVQSSTAIAHVGSDAGTVVADTKLGKGRIIILTDPYVIANNGISKADNLTLALNLLAERPEGDIAFDEYHHGYGISGRAGGATAGVMAYFSGTPVPWMMRQLGLIILLFVFSKGRRFARPLPLKRERRTTNLEFVSSMAVITRLARATDIAMQSIYTEFRRRLCQYAGLPPKSSSAALAEAASRRAKKNPARLKALMTRCEEVASGAPASDSEMLKLVAGVRELESSLKL
ncbi:MAG: hypothetical protein DMF61_17640 [Blastocatellia bacterium AA13]|nr:MAG: hypothetical protein DMF61_17640 [Blastocatellia bacterium AA13]